MVWKLGTASRLSLDPNEGESVLCWTFPASALSDWRGFNLFGMVFLKWQWQNLVATKMIWRRWKANLSIWIRLADITRNCFNIIDKAHEISYSGATEVRDGPIMADACTVGFRGSKYMSWPMQKRAGTLKYVLVHWFQFRCHLRHC